MHRSRFRLQQELEGVRVADVLLEDPLERPELRAFRDDLPGEHAVLGRAVRGDRRELVYNEVRGREGRSGSRRHRFIANRLDINWKKKSKGYTG